MDMPHVKHIPELVEFHRTRVERLRHVNDLPPPWEVYPEIPCGSIGWRMGPGEDVWRDWLTWLEALTPAKREEYRRRHPEPGSWSGIYDRQFEWFSRESRTMSWDEYWDAEFQRQYEMWGPVAQSGIGED